MISLWLEQVGEEWFGVAEHDARLVATVTGSSREEANQRLVGCLPDGAPHETVEQPNAFARDTVRMLASIESGDESAKRFELSSTYVREPIAGILRAAAAIPLGWATTYGSIARAAGTNARVVGRIMATNPLYPIVPCHRVVGSDLSLVGYGGRRNASALRAKLNRLRAEARRGEERWVDVSGEEPVRLHVVPVEWVIEKAEREEAISPRQLSLW